LATRELLTLATLAILAGCEPKLAGNVAMGNQRLLY
jgi:hypothetical protein